jgi:hypothetical protein
MRKSWEARERATLMEKIKSPISFALKDTEEPPRDLERTGQPGRDERGF